MGCGSGYRSTRTQRTPRWPSSMARPMPTGPPPTMTTSASRSLTSPSLIALAFPRRGASASTTDARDYAVMDDLFIPLWPPAWVNDHTLSDEQFVTATEDVKLMSAV